ncbi:uncharacterized protein LOC124357421 isoform X2 [Homalodisca vitripennis]|uniref:uncharacterized protein LOC124357421 isoform X2 n=1 Tax=Homalodisca vitripennis TaxID=197043 RepID=UPI001EEB8042|nr:uncharacterized protein LOC124357421 isoform X2 [Homalodisca vitripennis]
MTCEGESGPGPGRCTVGSATASVLPFSYCSMFTCFWHLWSWLDPPVTSPLASPAVITMTSIKKGYGSPTRRGNSQLRSPVIKRPLSAPVTIQGWLHKQGSDGLMLWKKRWFVLSDYCLFYYKTSEEEKLLGSILLPSYKISPCGVEDKIYRKFSFKAEHANMRTYYFAADTQPLMAQWMNALSLASILQESTSWEERKSTSSHQQNHSADDSDSGFHGHFRPTNDSSGECVTPSNGWRPSQQGYHQPLYANAPPKPRRLNNDTSSPERSPERASEDGSGRISKLAQPQEYTLRNERAYNYTAQHSHRPPLMLPPNSQPQERRTPDTYGRSNSTTPQTGKVISSKMRTLDYEDVYQTNPELVSAMYPQNVMYSNQPVQYRQNRPNDSMCHSMPSDGRKRFPPRPHSADFLEYDARRAYQSPTPQSSDSGNQQYYNQRNSVQPRRPKSSLDIVHSETGPDGTHWSEESYARKMRQSASYVSPQLQNLSNSSRATTPSVRQVPIMPGYYNGPMNGELASVMMRQHSEAIHAQERRWSEYVDRTNGQFTRSASARLPRHGNDDRMEDDGSDKSYQAAFRRRNSSDNRDPAIKSQQREESMKRLLEWKQRMLQSPLTRKSSGSSGRGTAQNQLSQYYQQVQDSRSRSLTNDTQPNPNAWRRDGWDKDVMEHARVARRKHSDAGRSRSQDGRRSVTSVSRYNSYSSDDEEPGGTRECRKRVRRSSKEASRSRVNSLEGKSSRAAPTPLSFPDYENVTLSEKTMSKDRTDITRTPTSQTKIRPDSDYSNLNNSVDDNKIDRNYSNKSPHRNKSSEDYGPGESFDSGNTLAESSILGYEDRFTISSKHSDSGYDTLQTGGVLPADPEVNDLLKFRFDKRKSPNAVVAYPVHTKTGKSFESWGEKIDESRLIKEFSYQYIKSNKNDGKNLEDDKDRKSSKVLLTKRFEIPPQNIVQNRIKVFETTKEDDHSNLAQNKENKLKMQEPLKMSSPIYQPNEAHVSSTKILEIKRESPRKTEEEMSNLRRSRRTSLHGFALGDAISMLDEEAKYAKRENLSNGQNPKSVKDLLADFERKSQLAQEQLAAEEKSSEDSPGKRCVFSDTETLLYDTSSDVENNHEREVLSGLTRSEMTVSEDDEDRDEEVAAVLGRKDKFVSSCRDLGRKIDSKQRNNKSFNSSADQNEIEKNVTPGYMRLSMTESVVTYEDSGSHSSTPKLEQTKIDEHKPKLSSSPEQHYMPMTPSKKPFVGPIIDVFAHTRTSSMSQSFTAENGGEESSYVEMTNGNIQSLLAPDSGQEQVSSSVLTDTQNYCEIRTEKDSVHYEFLYKASTSVEPLYMEVSPLLEGDNNDGKNHSFKENSTCPQREETEGAEQPPTPPRTALPDILNPSLNGNQKQSSIKSDSSDADDEASKDLDSLDAPRHPRFSLSDTFRPASYYLGASIGERTLIGMTAEHPDSSDSDLVSPPPIPTSPPPLDDLETSLESAVDVKKLSPVQIKSDSCKIDIEGKDNSRRLWNPTPLLGKDVRSLQERMESLNLSPILDDNLSSETDSVDSSKRDRLLKRRPVSADILNSLQDPGFLHCSSLNGRQSGGSDLDSVGSRNGLAMDLEEGEGIDFDHYLEDLQNNSQLAPKLPVKDIKYDCYKSHENQKYDSQNTPSTIVMPESISYTPDGSSSNNQEYRTKYKQPYPYPSPLNRNDEVHYENLQGLFPPPPSAEYLQELSSENDTTIRYSSPEGGLPRSSPVRIVEGQANREINLQAGAPYYYSDLLKAEQANQASNRMSNISRSVRMQQLNNQREDNNLTEVNFLNKRNDIGRRVNAIHQLLPGQVIDRDDAAKLAEELRTTSVHFLGTADKIGHVDERNLYEADTLQRRKAVAMIEQRYRSQTPDLRSSARNLYPHGIRDKNEIIHGQERQPRRRSRSLEGLLDEPEFLEPEPRQNRVSPGSAISRLLQTTQPQPQSCRSPVPTIPTTNALRSSRSRAPPPPPDVWEEDSLWRESLRRVSIRHTRSLDNLDRDSPREVTPTENRKVSREVTYVNDSVTLRSRSNHREYEEDYREGRLIRQVRAPVEPEVDDGVHYERLVPRDSEILDRTRRGQTYIEGYVWDEEREMFHRGEKSNMPIRDPPRKPSQPFLEVGLYPTRPPSFEIDREKLRQWDLMSSAPAGMLGAGGGGGGGLRRGAESAPLVNLADNTPPSSPASGSGSVIGRDPLPPRQVVPPPVVDQAPPITHNPDLIHHKRPERGWSLQLSAGELLGRTHEELVLLLIQLRRQSAGFCKAMEACHMEIEAQARLVELETPKRMEHLQKLEDLKRHLLELEKQYEKGKPLVNLVDNMVKLGSLYRVGAPLPGASPTTAPLLRDRLEFNHQVQERRLLAEERRDWERLSPDHNQLQAKVEQLYRLDRLLQEESGTLQSLQQDKEMLERALGGLRHKLQAVGSNPAQAEKYRRQQRLLERELSRVRSILAHNSKKLEETVAENARLEQELVVLRQKLVWSRRAPDQSVSSTAQLEAELARVQSLVGDLQRQRLELSSQVRQLTERSNSLSQQIRPSPTGVQAYQMGYYRTYPGVGAVGSKKTLTSSWLETDLDTQVTQDLGRDSPLAPQASPLYVNTDVSKSLDVCSTYEGSVSQDDQQELTSAPPTPQQAPPPPPPPAQSPAHYTRPMAPMDISEADDRIKRFYGIIPRDKPQEIKTVRIVKRESERRQRDRDRSGNIGIPLTNTTTAKRVTIIEENVPVESVDRGLGRVVEEQPEPPSEVFGGSLAPRPPPAPGPRSDSVQALRNLVTRQRARLDSDSTSPSHSVSAHEQLFGSSDTLLSPQLSPVYQSQAARQIVEEMAVTNRRAVPREKRRHHTVSGRPLLRIDTSYSAGGSRDDLDMERALRPRLNTPDVVRSTLSRSEVKYTTETIDSILGTPGKILIPERYVPESTPELSSEEQQRRNKKAESIRKMLSETTQISAPDDNNEPVEEDEKSLTLKKKVAEEKRQREHLLQLNQILAHQVMEKSKMVAVRALATLPLSTTQTDESDLSSPEEPLPLYQQRENYFS